jgi:hypothetical protein
MVCSLVENWVERSVLQLAARKAVHWAAHLVAMMGHRSVEQKAFSKAVG